MLFGVAATVVTGGKLRASGAESTAGTPVAAGAPAVAATEVGLAGAVADMDAGAVAPAGVVAWATCVVLAVASNFVEGNAGAPEVVGGDGVEASAAIAASSLDFHHANRDPVRQPLAAATLTKITMWQRIKCDVVTMASLPGGR